MQRSVWFVAGVVAMALATWMAAWWTVPIVGAAWAFVRREDAAAPLLAGLAAMAAWALLLLISAATANVGAVLRVVGAAMQLGPAALVALTLAFAGLLAASAGALVRAVVGPHGRPD
ncbi:MAG: hypothetical protein OEW77_10185 [Gemmatimonadota bacterium]|nr:hypothetical protein [Gemmatimonadota bacterium]